MRASDVLRGARELIALGVLGGPVQRADAVDRHGRKCYPTEGHANRWSMTGALLKAGRDADGGVFLIALAALGETLGISEPDNNRALCLRIWEWEDQPGRRIEHVLAAFERAEEGVSHGKQEAQAAGRRATTPAAVRQDRDV